MKQNLNEELSRIKSIMGINESETPQDIPADVMASIEAEADELIANSVKERQENERIRDGIKELMNKEGGEVYAGILKDIEDKLKRFYSPEDKERIINGLIDHYKRSEGIRKYHAEREERIKTAKLTKDQIIDVFVTAIEGGSNYWYYILDIPKEITYMIDHDGKAFSEACGEYVLNGGTLTIYDIEEVQDMEEPDNEYATDKPKPLGHIDIDSLLDAIGKIREEHPEVYENIVMDEYDADDADIFFQLATMGEIVFG